MTAVFVGRERELALLERIRAESRSTGRRRLVVVTGEAGIGKTWFCERVAREADDTGWTVVEGRCWPHGGAPALWPWPQLLTDLIGSHGAGLLGGPDGDGVVDPERFARFSAVADAIRRLDRPTLVVLDDAHYAEQATLLLTRFLVGALERNPLVLVIARRPDPRPLLDELERDSTVVPLRRFDAHDAVAFLAANVDGPTDERGLVRALLRTTGGIPMFLARAVAHGLSASERESGPASLRQAVADALDRLPPDARGTLTVAAVLGTGCSIGEIATLSDAAPATVLSDLAAAAGLVEVRAREVVFDHELIRQAALNLLPAGALLDLHARAAQQLATTGAAQRVARHALAAAARSDQDAADAVAACLAAADAARRGYDYETAAVLLGAAADVSAHLADTRQRALVLVEQADAVLACGRLIEARTAFGWAADAAEQAGDPVLVARAVLGLGGVWVHEHRNDGDRLRVLARQRAALAALPSTESALRCRLEVRIAAEAVYEGGPVDRAFDALAAARTVGDDRVLAEALSLTHHAVLAPEHARRRLAMADELVGTASAAGDGVLTLFGLLWRTVDLYELGDPAAERALAALRERVDALGVATVGYIVACMDVMRLIRAGRLADAEAAAGTCLALGLEVGDADATGYYGAQLLVVRWLQGRDAELADLVLSTAQSPTLAVPEYAFQMLVGAVLARGGRHAEARAALSGPLAGGIANLPRSSTWTSAVVAAIEAAHVLGDGALAGEAARLLEPFAQYPVMPSLAVSCIGVAARALGLAALAQCDLDAAVDRFEQAVAGNDHIRHRPAAAMSRADLAGALTARGGTADRERAAGLFRAAAVAAAEMDMPQRVREWSARAEEVAPVEDPAALTHNGHGWTLHAGGPGRDLPDLVGFGYLAVLLARPGRDVSAVELCGSVQAVDQDLLDTEALAAYRKRLRELDCDIADARADADLGRLEVLGDEHDALTAELRSSLGLGGRIRGFGGPPERARTAVRKAIKRALDVLADHEPVLGAQLRDGVLTGSTCRYEPRPGARSWQVHPR